MTYSADATFIVAPLTLAKAITAERREATKPFTDRINVATLTAYARCAVIIAAMMAQGTWTARKQRGGAKSASVLLKEALMVEAEAHKIAESRAKRLVETAVRMMAKVPGTKEAATNSDAEAVLAVLAEAKIKNEAALLRAVLPEPKADDPVEMALAWVADMTPAQRADFEARLASLEGDGNDDGPAPRGRGASPEARVVRKPA